MKINGSRITILLILLVITFFAGFFVGRKSAVVGNKEPRFFSQTIVQHDTIYRKQLVSISEVQRDTIIDTLYILQDYFTAKTYAFDFADEISKGQILVEVAKNEPQKIEIHHNAKGGLKFGVGCLMATNRNGIKSLGIATLAEWRKHAAVVGYDLQNNALQLGYFYRFK